MRKRGYYSVRSGKHPARGLLNLEEVQEQVLAVYEEMERGGYFQQAFGYYCVDSENNWGDAGANIGAFFFKKLKKKDLWPVPDRIYHYSEDDLFDVVELLFDCVSKPTKGYYHDFSGCGWHYREFDKAAGQVEFRNEVNETLGSYGAGYELSTAGEVFESAPPGMAYLEAAELPKYDSENVNDRVEDAIRKFRDRKSSLSDRKDAVVGLASVLEFLRPKLDKVLIKKDESDLFNIANNFGLRHHTSKQQTNYDKDIWYSWIFYHYLSTIHAVLRLIERKNSNAVDQP